MSDVFDEVSRFDNDFRPQPARRPDVSILPDGDFDFEIVDAAPERVGKNRDAALRLGLKVLSGPAAGNVVDHLWWLTSQDNIDRLGSDLNTLGLDADQWKAPARPFSRELQNALPRLRGLRFRGRKQKNESGGKVYQNLYVQGLIKGSTAPPPAVVAPAQQPALVRNGAHASEERIPF